MQCTEYENYLYQTQMEGVSVVNDFAPKTKLAKLLRHAAHRSDNDICLDSFSNAHYYENYELREPYYYSSSMEGYSIPADGFSIYLTAYCATTDERVRVYSKKLNFRNKTLTPEEQDDASQYKLFRGFTPRHALNDSISISPFKTPDTSQTEVITFYKRGQLSQQIATPFTHTNINKYAYIPWASAIDHVLLESKLIHPVYGTVDEVTSPAYIDFGLADLNAPASCSVEWQCTQDGELVRTIGGHEVVLKGKRVDCNFFYSQCSQQVHYAIASTYRNMSEACTAKGRRTCTPLPAGICHYANLFCRANATGSLICYDGTNRKYEKCEAKSDVGQRDYVKCDFEDSS